MGNLPTQPTEEKIQFQRPQLDSSTEIKFSKRTFFYSIPLEIISNILSHLSISDLSKLSLVNQAFYTISNSDIVWKDQVIQSFVLLSDIYEVPHIQILEDKSWKEKYFLLDQGERLGYSGQYHKKRVKKDWNPLMQTVDNVHRVVTIGLSEGGKSLLLYKLAKEYYKYFDNIYENKDFDEEKYSETYGFQVHVLDILRYKNHYVHLSWWDIGGGESIRPLWVHYTYGTEVFVIMIDGINHNIKDVKFEFERLKNKILDDEEQLPEFIFLINKSDLGPCIAVYEIYLALDLENLKTNFKILSVSVKNWKGINDALEWICRDW